MTLDGAGVIEDVTPDAWILLARETGFSARFVRTATEALIERVVDESGRLAAGPRHDNPTAKQIRERAFSSEPSDDQQHGVAMRAISSKRRRPGAAAVAASAPSRVPAAARLTARVAEATIRDMSGCCSAADG